MDDDTGRASIALEGCSVLGLHTLNAHPTCARRSASSAAKGTPSSQEQTEFTLGTNVWSGRKGQGPC